MKKLRSWLNEQVSAAPLAVFRIVFGLMMAASLIRFWSNGWIEQLYIQPDFHFSYLGFDWVHSLGNPGMYLLFLAGITGALMVAVGLWYRIGATIFALSFTYIELIDKSTYLNHYYFISLVAFLMIIVPAHRRFSLDSWLGATRRSMRVPRWSIAILIFQLSAVYFFAGLAKLNSDWLLEAQPLATWLPAHASLPVIGSLMDETATAYAFSWFGAAYDLCIPFLLLWGRTRNWAYAAVIVFHGLTALLFPIGMFPWIMILSTLIFFPAAFHEKLLGKLGERIPNKFRSSGAESNHTRLLPRIATTLIIGYALVQLLLPFRHLLYPGELFWNEQGYRFSWRVMLIEKAGHAQFRVEDDSGRSYLVDNSVHLTPLQEKMMSTQPDMIVQYAEHLEQVFKEKGWQNPRIFADVHVALNGRGSRLFIDPTVNLAECEYSLKPRHWVLPFNDRIHGL